MILQNYASDAINKNMITKDYVDGVISSVFLSNEIKTDIISERKQRMREGVNYYNGKHDILKAKANEVTIKGVNRVILGKPNTKAVHTFLSLQVDQKKDYLLSKGIELTFENEAQEKRVRELLGDYFDSNINNLVMNASIKGVEWLHYFINENGGFDWVVIPAEQIIAINDGKFDRKLEAIIRYYNTTFTNIETGKIQIIKKAEVWTAEDVTYYVQSGNGYIKDQDEILNPRPHVIKGDFLTNDNKKTLTVNEIYNWGEVPFIPLYNNPSHSTDLEPIKSLIDLYDTLISEGANTIIEVQDAIWEVRGYEGESIEELSLKLKQNKVVDLTSDDGSGIKAHQLDIPFDARKDLLEKTKDAIYEQGRAIDFGRTSFGNSPSGIALKFLYSSLDIKCNALELNLKETLQTLFGAIKKWLKEIENIDIGVIGINIIRDVLQQEPTAIERTTMIKDSYGILSQETLIANHPFEVDVKEELKRIENEKSDIDAIEI